MNTMFQISQLANVITEELIDRWPACMMEVEFDSLSLVTGDLKIQIVWEMHSGHYALYRNNSKYENLIGKQRTRAGVIQFLYEFCVQ